MIKVNNGTVLPAPRYGLHKEGHERAHVRASRVVLPLCLLVRTDIVCVQGTDARHEVAGGRKPRLVLGLAVEGEELVARAPRVALRPIGIDAIEHRLAEELGHEAMRAPRRLCRVEQGAGRTRPELPRNARLLRRPPKVARAHLGGHVLVAFVLAPLQLPHELREARVVVVHALRVHGARVHGERTLDRVAEEDGGRVPLLVDEPLQLLEAAHTRRRQRLVEQAAAEVVPLRPAPAVHRGVASLDGVHAARKLAPRRARGLRHRAEHDLVLREVCVGGARPAPAQVRRVARRLALRLVPASGRSVAPRGTPVIGQPRLARHLGVLSPSLSDHIPSGARLPQRRGGHDAEHAAHSRLKRMPFPDSLFFALRVRAAPTQGPEPQWSDSGVPCSFGLRVPATALAPCAAAARGTHAVRLGAVGHAAADDRAGGAVVHLLDLDHLHQQAAALGPRVRLSVLHDRVQQRTPLRARAPD
eukprot:scaffold111740_cov66-Phaeocystis_antarctica.AAC.1